MDFLALLPDLVKMTVAMFIVVNPLGSVPIFVGLTKDMDESRRKKTYRLATITGLMLLAFFSLVGQNVLVLFGISWGSFMIAGGILLLIVAIRLLIIGGWSEHQLASESVGAVPIGCPLLVGPGAITTSILNIQSFGIFATLLSVFLTFVIVWLILRFIDPIYRVLGKNGSLVITRVMALLIAAISVQYILDGIKSGLL